MPPSIRTDEKLDTTGDRHFNRNSSPARKCCGLGRLRSKDRRTRDLTGGEKDRLIALDPDFFGYVEEFPTGLW